MPAGRVTEIDVGLPPYAPDEVETFNFNFHRFAFIPAPKGNGVPTPPFSCFGHQWQLTLFPGGDEASEEGDFMSIWLTKVCNGHAGCYVKYKVSVIGLGDGIEREHMFDDANPTQTDSNFMELDRPIPPRTNFLVDGTLVVELQMWLDGKSDLICRLPRKPFVPDNSCEKKMDALWFQDEQFTDVLFVIPPYEEEGGAKKLEKGGEEELEGGQQQRLPTIQEEKDTISEGEEEKSEEYRVYAHRAVLQGCAPGLYELCESYGETEPVIVARVKPHVFHLLLGYVYGRSVSFDDWKEHSRELIDAADRYGVADLKLEAEAWFIKFMDITAENALDLLHYADAKNLASLKESVMDYFVNNGKEALVQISFDQIPENRSLFTDLMLSLSVGHARGGGDDECDYKVMRVGCLRRELDNLGLDVDGSRETLVKRLEEARPPLNDAVIQARPPLNDAVIQAIRTLGANSDTGPHLNEVVQQVSPQGYSARVIKEAINRLLNEGYIYSTIDENHFFAHGA
ncbi:hypothetical protein ACHAXT_008457 [Thalassiosira profunda]